jgi:hypothetical protein
MRRRNWKVESEVRTTRETHPPRKSILSYCFLFSAKTQKENGNRTMLERERERDIHSKVS